MTQLVLYESARSALAEARRVDEVKDIRDKAEAIRAYARMAGDTALEQDAAELRLRAERRMGILIAAEKAAGRLRRGPDKSTGEEQIPRVKLEELGIDRKLSARSQRVGGIAERAFEAMVERTRQRIADGAQRTQFDLSNEDKKIKRAEREAELAAQQRALPNRKYGVILADPEWEFEVWSEDTGNNRAAANHYPTSSTDKIAARPVIEIAADDCVLFLWATAPKLPDAMRVLDAWGFRYVTHAIWVKNQIGTGYWFRNKHEILLIGKRGNPPKPANGTQFESAILSPRQEHSRKPDWQYEIIERYFPNLPKIELNARRARDGWDAWGLEAPTTADGTPIDHDEAGEIIESESVAEHLGPHGEDPAVVDVSPCAPAAGSDDLDIPQFLQRPLEASAHG